MKISFHGAARTVTGSKHLLHIGDSKKILLDCGMFQGLGKDTMTLNGEWGFDPKEVTHVILSHAHIDHVGLLPKLVKDGYRGKVYCTPATASIAKLLMTDSAHIQEADIKYVNKHRKKENRPLLEPLYTQDDVENVYPLLEPISYNDPFVLDHGIELTFTDCGHILGSAAVNLTIREGKEITRLTFSGDVGRYRDMILRSPQEFPQADYIIIESTYGDKLHDMQFAATDTLLDHIVDTCLKKKGKLIIPAFSLGRTQELLYMLNRLELEKRLPPIPYYVDSPLSVKITDTIKRYPHNFNADVQKLLRLDDDVFSFKGLIHVSDVQDSIKLNDNHEPCVIISASGMAEAGRVKHHIANNITNANNKILFPGYCEPRSLGGRLKQRPDEVKIFGRPFPVRAEIAEISSLSAHADYDDLCQWLSCQNPKEIKKIFLVHGEYDVQSRFKERLIHKGFLDVEIPDLHDEYGI